MEGVDDKRTSESHRIEISNRLGNRGLSQFHKQSRSPLQSLQPQQHQGQPTQNPDKIQVQQQSSSVMSGGQNGQGRNQYQLQLQQQGYHNQLKQAQQVYHHQLQQGQSLSQGQGQGQGQGQAQAKVQGQSQSKSQSQLQTQSQSQSQSQSRGQGQGQGAQLKAQAQSDDIQQQILLHQAQQQRQMQNEQFQLVRKHQRQQELQRSDQIPHLPNSNQEPRYQHLQTSKLEYPELTEYDLKSRDSKYKRWTPKMDQFLIKLLSDVVHSYPKNGEPEMSKKAWAYVTGQLRAANPETVYSTYTKYSCQQHLLNVNHHRYKIWYVLMLHQKNHPSTSGYSYRWNPDLGKFQIIDINSGSLILDERQVKSILYSEQITLPTLSSFNKGNLVVNDFFLSDNLKYMSVYHNEVLELLIRLDPKYSEGLGDIFQEIPKFDYHEMNNDYFKPLVHAKVTKILHSPEIHNDALINDNPNNNNKVNSKISNVHNNATSYHNSNNANNQHLPSQPQMSMKNHLNTDPINQNEINIEFNPKRLNTSSHTSLDNSSNQHLQQIHQLSSQRQTQMQQHSQQELQHHSKRSYHQLVQQQSTFSNNQQQKSVQSHEDESVDPALKRSHNQNDTNLITVDYEILANAAIAAINSPPVTNGRDPLPFYIKDRKWFNKLISLYESGHLAVDEIVSVCEGVRDGKIPLFMLNVLDQTFYSTADNSGTQDELSDDEMAKRIREFMLPMVYNT